MIEYYKINESSEIKHQLSGKGLRNCLFIISQEEFESGENKLEEILKAVKLDKNKDVLFWLTDQLEPDNLQHIVAEYGISVITSFGMDVNAFYPNLMIKDYQLSQMEAFTWLSVPRLSKVLSSRDEKMKLWKALQALFLN